MAGAAQAQTNQRHYASSASINGNVTSYGATSPSDNSAEPVLAAGNALAIPLGTRYTAIADAPADSETATPTVNVVRSEEHTSELQSLMRISYAVFCLKKKTHN